jgi:diguanylate cyclase (GGDEF)-like protein/PAS domain S-box-containing protein
MLNHPLISGEIYFTIFGLLIVAFIAWLRECQHHTQLESIKKQLHHQDQIISQANHLEQKYSLLERAINASSNGIVIVDAIENDRPIIYVNSGFEKLTGYSATEVIGQNCRFLQNQDRNQAELLRLRQAIEAGQECRVTLRNYRKDGSFFWNQLYISPVQDLNGNLTHFIGIQTDATERKQAEASLEFSQYSLERVNECIFWLYADGSIFDVNQATCDLLGYSQEELLQFKAWDVAIECSPEFWQEHWQQLETRKTFTFETLHLTKTGEVIPVEVNMNYLEFNNIAYNCALVRDLRKRKQAEAERDRFLTLSLDLLCVAEFNGHFKRINPAFEHILGYSQEELLARPFIEFVHPEDREATHQEMAKLSQGEETIFFENRYRCQDGSYRWFSWTGVPYMQEQLIYAVAHDITQRKQREAEIQETKKFLQTMIDHLPVALFVKDGHPEKFGQMILWNKTCEKMFGVTAQQAIGKTVYDHFPLEQAQFFEEKDRQAFAQKIPEDIPEEPIDSHSLGRRLLHTLKIPLYDQDGQPQYLLCISEDITERFEIELALRDSEQRLEGILNSIQDVVWSVSAHTLAVIYLNPATERVYGRPITDFFQSSNLWTTIVHPEDQPLLSRQIQLLQEMGQVEYEYRIIRPDQEVRWVYSRAKVVYDDQGQPVRFDGIDTDITERKHFTEQLQYNAYHDPLTNLPNRTFLLQHLQNALDKIKQQTQQTFAVLFLDLDDFKVVNDSLGHLVGDHLLKIIAQRLRANLDSSYTLARFGGDEFTILVENIRDVQEVIDIAEDIHHHLTYPYTLNNEQIFINTSIGIALSDTSYQHPQEILRDADTAMYKAKEKGKGCYAVFDQQMHQRVLNRLLMEVELRQALEQEQFLLYYQPIVSLTRGCITGFEALIRWHHPSKGMISPTDFIPVAEETGLIIPMGKWILAEACSQLKAWQEKVNLSIPLKMSVNLSSKQLRDATLIEEIDTIIQDKNLDYQCLKLEITESLLMENVDIAMELLLQLKERKIELSLDDFGTGYSSLSYLHRFPVSTVKIDRSFVMRMQSDNSNVEIIRAIVTLAHTLDMQVIAEGVETGLQLAKLKCLDCELGQGYFFAQPLDPDAALALLQDFPLWL